MSTAISANGFGKVGLQEILNDLAHALFRLATIGLFCPRVPEDDFVRRVANDNRIVG
jgi:hypothetical protein